MQNAQGACSLGFSFIPARRTPDSKLSGRSKLFAILTIPRDTAQMAHIPRRPSHAPWNNWYHCMFHTYGTWLPGDPHGFRTRHGRQHIDGDYKNPPREDFTALHKHSASLLKRPPVRFSPEQRTIVRDALLASFAKWCVELVVLSVDSIHVHLLARFPRQNPRHFIGLAKKESSAFLKRMEGFAAGGLWGARAQCEPIENRAHQVSTVRYILRHQDKGAAVHFQKRAK
jgi:REP element-mobilizing transposase RayT